MRHNRVRCDVCEGTGRTTPDHPNDPSGRTMICHYGCDNGYFDATPADLDGKRARVSWLTGVLFVWHGVLCLETEDMPGLVVPVDPITVELLT